MTKEITKAYIIQQIQDKLGLRDLEPARFAFNETVVPVYNIEQHLLETNILTKTVSIASTGGKLFHEVPDNEKWFVNGYTVIFMTGAFTIAGVYVVRNIAPVGNIVYLDLTAAQSVSYTVNLPKPLEMHPSDALRINVDGYTSTGNLRMDIDYVVETIR